jgi:hypothetical protein
MVGDGQRITVAAITELELALEVGAPQVGSVPCDSGVSQARWRALPPDWLARPATMLQSHSLASRLPFRT